jgi:hypothetical protein
MSTKADRNKIDEGLKALPRKAATLAEAWNAGDPAKFKKVASEIKRTIREAENIFMHDLYDNLK